jgi:hypothetical protein
MAKYTIFKFELIDALNYKCAQSEEVEISAYGLASWIARYGLVPMTLPPFLPTYVGSYRNSGGRRVYVRLAAT